jgi:hypothetical protein
MAVFKAPRISTFQRSSLLLEASEIVYDTDQNSFYGGNGLDVGGFPIGQGIGAGEWFYYTLDSSDINNKKIPLPREPFSPGSVRLNIIGGIEQVNGTDFIVIGSELSWDGLGLDNFLEIGYTLLIQI